MIQRLYNLHASSAFLVFITFCWLNWRGKCLPFCGKSISMTFVEGPKRLNDLLVFYWPFKGQERRCLIFKINNNEDSKIPFVKYSLLDTILLYRLVKYSWNQYNPFHFIFTECQPDWTIRGSETSGLSWTQKQKWAKSCTSKGVEGERSWRSHWDDHWNSNQKDIRTLLPTLLFDCFDTLAFNSLVFCFFILFLCWDYFFLQE